MQSCGTHPNGNIYQSMPKTQETLLRRGKKEHKSQRIPEFAVSLSPSNTNVTFIKSRQHDGQNVR